MNMKEITEEIERLEEADTNYSNCDKLATLYTVKDGLSGKAQSEKPYRTVQPSYSYAEASNSAFIEAFNSVPIEYALSVIDEHMEAIKALYPKEYKAIMRKLSY